MCAYFRLPRFAFRLFNIDSYHILSVDSILLSYIYGDVYML